MKRSEITEKFPDRDPKMGTPEAGIPPASETEIGPKPVRNFEKEVHSWNPTLPMWRRSNKE
ncbi:MAG: hypothetical protein ACLP0H_11685 [Terriglobales bacterium]